MCIVKMRRAPRFAPLSGANLGILYVCSAKGLNFFHAAVCCVFTNNPSGKEAAKAFVVMLCATPAS